MKTAIETMNDIREHGSNVADDSPKTVGALAVGDHTAQGDVNFTRLESVPNGAVKLVNPPLQLAPGTTKGSRHVLQPGDFTMHRLSNPNPLQGPVIEAREPVTVTHPEHGDQTFPAGIWFVTYQRAHAQELRRVAD